MRRSSTEKDVTTLRKEIKRLNIDREREMRRSNTAKDVTTLARGSSEATSFSVRRNNSSRLYERRKSLPTEELQDDIQKMNITRCKTSSHRNRSQSSKTYKIKFTLLTSSLTASVDNSPNDAGLITLNISTDRNRLFPAVPTGLPLEVEGHHNPMNRNVSGELNAFRQTFGRTVQPATAWSSLSRTSSKTTSFSSSYSNSRPSSQYECDFGENDELMVSNPNSLQFLQKDLEDDADHTRLPSITMPSQHAKHKTNSGKRPHRKSLPDEYELQSDLLPDAFYSEVLRVLSNIKMLEFEARNSSVIACRFKGALFHITVNRGGRGKFLMHFEWISGGNEKYFSEIREHILNMLVL